jgi:hypothetical protein
MKSKNQTDDNPLVLTQSQKLDYAVRLRLFAVRCIKDGDNESADLNVWMAEQYEKNA